MIDRPRLWERPSLLVVSAILLLILSSTAGAKAPTLEHLDPSGGTRGSHFEVTAAGKFDRWPIHAWSSSPGLQVKPRSETGKLSVSIADDLEPGLYWIRLFDDEGPTAARPFLVGTLPEAAEVEPNDDPARAQTVESGVTINGRLGKPGDVDGFRLSLKKGQTLVASMEANRTLGSPMDALLQVASIEGFVLAQVDDALDRDPRIVFEVPRDGDYLVRTFAFPFVQESTIRFAGNLHYIYRLTLTTRGIVDHTFPLSVSHGGSGEVETVGWNIPEPARKLLLDTPDDKDSITLWHPLLANSVEVRLVDEPTSLEIEPNDRNHPQPIALPIALSGRIDRPGDVDTFTFPAHKGEKIVFDLASRELGMPLDAVLRIGDSTGVTLVEVDDARKAVDPEIRFTVPGDGNYRVSVHDLNGHGGTNYPYLLVAGRPRPDFRLTFKTDLNVIKPGQTLDLIVLVERRDGYDEPIEINLADRFDGLISDSVVSRKSGPTAASVTLKLRSCECVGPGPIRVAGVSGDGRRQLATAPVPGLSRPIDSAWLTPSIPPTSKPNPAN